jgi:hypothetical protein
LKKKPTIRPALSISRLWTPSFQNRKPEQKRQQRPALEPVRTTKSVVLPLSQRPVLEVRAAEPKEVETEPIRPKTVTPFCKKSFIAKLDCFQSEPHVALGLLYANGHVLSSLDTVMEPHAGVIHSILRDSYVCDLFTAKDQKLTDLAPLFPRPEQFYDLLNGESALSQRLLRKSPMLRHRAAGSLGEEQPLERFLNSMPGMWRADMDAVYLEDRRKLLGEDACSKVEGVVRGDCFPCVERMELEGRSCMEVEHSVQSAPLFVAEMRVAGFTVLRSLLQ